jgi:hypothetical protein
MAKAWREDPHWFNNLAWRKVMRGQSPEVYAVALRQAEACCRIEPDNALYINTLGVLQYRIGRDEDAVANLSRSDRMNAASKIGQKPSDVAFLAMAHYRLGHRDQAKTLLAQLRELVKLPPWSTYNEPQDFLREAEELIGSKP